MAATHGLPKKKFALARPELREVLEKGRRHAGRCMVLCVLHAEGGRKFGVSASRRVGGAVERNRAKRLMREIMRLNRDRVKEGSRIVAIARADIFRNSFKEKELEFINLLSKSGAIEKNILTRDPTIFPAAHVRINPVRAADPDGTRGFISCEL